MPIVEVQLPIKGINKAFPVGSLPSLTTSYMNNVRPVDVNEDRIRIGQRPGLDKWSTTDLSGGVGGPVVALVSVSKVEVE